MSDPVGDPSPKLTNISAKPLEGSTISGSNSQKTNKTKEYFVNERSEPVCGIIYTQYLNIAYSDYIELIRRSVHIGPWMVEYSKILNEKNLKRRAFPTLDVRQEVYDVHSKYTHRLSEELKKVRKQLDITDLHPKDRKHRDDIVLDIKHRKLHEICSAFKENKTPNFFEYILNELSISKKDVLFSLTDVSTFYYITHRIISYNLLQRVT